MNSDLSTTDPVARLFEELVKGMCRYPRQCVVEGWGEHDPSIGLGISILPHMADFAVIVGKGGRQIRALQFLAKRIGERQGRTIGLRLEESYVGQPEAPLPFQQNPEVNEAELLAFVERWLDVLFAERPHYTCERSCDKLIVRVRVLEEDTQGRSVVSALGDVFYPYGYKQGLLLDIKLAKSVG